MGTIIMHNVVSVDGFIADENDDVVGPLHDWYFSGDTPITEGGHQQFHHSGTGSGFKVSAASVAEYARSMWDSIGVIVMGRHLFDLVDGWEGHPPTSDHVVVVSHRPKPRTGTPEASYHFVDGVTAAIDKAQELAGERTVAVNAGEVGSQVLAADLVAEVATDVVPVVLGSGKRYLQHRRTASPRGSPRGCPGRPGATPEVQGTPLDPEGMECSILRLATRPPSRQDLGHA